MAFRAFRLVVGLILGGLAAWMVGGGAHDMYRALSSEEAVAASTLIPPVLGIVGGLVILAIYYYALWSESSLRQGLENIAGVMDRATLVRSHVEPDLGHILHSRHQYHWHTGQPSRFCFISRVLHEGSMRVWWPVRANQEAPGDRFRTSARSKRTQTPMLTSEQIASLGPKVYPPT